METPLAAAVHKENVHIGGGKATVMKNPDKLKPEKTGAKKRKALADLRNACGPRSKDVDLKQKSGMRGNEAKKNLMTQGKQQALLTDLGTTNECLVNGAPKSGNLNLRNFEMGNTPSDFMLTDEEIKRCYEWAEEGIEGMGGYSWSAKDEANLVKNQTLSEIMASAIGVPVEELEQPFLSDGEGYVTDERNMNSSISFSGRLSPIYTPEELEDPLGVAGIVLDEYPYPSPELKLDDDY